MLKWLMELELKDCVKLISNMMVENGIALNDIITDIHNQGTFLKDLSLKQQSKFITEIYSYSTHSYFTFYEMFQSRVS